MCGRDSQHFADVINDTCTSGDMVRTACGLLPHVHPTDEELPKVREILARASLADPQIEAALDELNGAPAPAQHSSDGTASYSIISAPAIPGAGGNRIPKPPRAADGPVLDDVAAALPGGNDDWWCGGQDAVGFPYGALCLAAIDSFNALSPLRSVSEDLLVGEYALRAAGFVLSPPSCWCVGVLRVAACSILGRMQHGRPRVGCGVWLEGRWAWVAWQTANGLRQVACMHGVAQSS